MSCTPNTRALFVTFLSGFLAIPAFAAGPQTKPAAPKKTEEVKPAELESLAGRHIQKMQDAVASYAKDMDALREELNARLTAAQTGIDKLKAQINKAQDPSQIKAQVAQLKEIDQLKTQMATMLKDMEQGARLKELDQLRQQMARLHQDIEQLANIRKEMVERKLPARNESQGSQPSKTAEPAANTGRICLVNDYPGPVTVILNDKSVYRLEKGGTQDLDSQPAGSFTYEIITPGGSRPLATRELAAKETITLTILGQ